MKDAVVPLGPPPPPDAAQPPPVWKPGVLEEIATKAGLAPQRAFDVAYEIEYPDSETLVRRMLAPGPVGGAIEAAGEERVRDAIVSAFAPHRRIDGSYALENKWHHLVAVSQ